MHPNKASEFVKATRKIHGWFSFEAGMFFAWIDEIQKANGLIGDIFEIGVHHGKSAAFLGAMVRPEQEVLGICDLFGDQSSNVSGSGSGNRNIFDRNMKACFSDGLPMQVFAKSSKSLRTEEIGASYRFFHIDGGHNPDEALNDLQLAAESILESGVIAVDDPLRPEWPGVSEAVFRFLTSHKEFCAIVTGFNKMIITRRDSADLYLREIDKLDQHVGYNILFPWHMKTLIYLDFPMRIFYVPTYLTEKSLGTKVIRFYQRKRRTQTPLLGPVARLVKLVLPC